MTAVLAPPRPLPPPDLADRLRRFSVAEYRRLVESGGLDERDPVVLIEGYLVETMPQNRPHTTAVRRVQRLLDGFAPGWVGWCQMPVYLPDSAPEPDFALLRGTIPEYEARDPLAADVGLVVEVADSTLAADRTASQRIYARAGVPVYWIVNLPDRQVEVYTAPDPAADPPAYRVRTDYRPGEAVPVPLDGETVGTVAVSDVLP